MARMPALGYALLALIQQKPASGYDLRKIFSSTSIQYYSDSPGAIYPALGRLARQRLVRAMIEEAWDFAGDGSFISPPAERRN